MREPLELRSNLKNRSNHKPVQLYFWRNLLSDLKFWHGSKVRKKIIKRENDEEDPKMKKKNIRSTNGMVRFKKEEKEEDEMSCRREEDNGWE